MNKQHQEEQDAARDLLASAGYSVEQPEPGSQPCAEGFHWIGQSFAHCDKCGLPAWDHAGTAGLPPGAGPFGRPDWVLKPYADGEAERIKAKWDR